MKKIDYSQEEKLIAETIIEARKIQEYIWQELSYTQKPYTPNMTLWAKLFKKE